MTIGRYLRNLAVLGAFVPLAACGEVLSLDVEAPGRIADDDLNNPDAVPGLVAGMSYDFSESMDSQLQEVLMAGGELWHGGSYNFGTIPRGILQQEDELWDGAYGSMQQARWVAENGLQRIAEIIPETFDRDPNVARAYLIAGFANRQLGEIQCTSTIDGGPEVENTEHFRRADSLFTRAIQVGQAANQTAIVRAAYGGRASVRAWLGDWTGAVSDATQVPANFQYFAIYTTQPGGVSNDLVFETTSRKEFTVFSTMWEDITDDARVPWEIAFDNSGQVEVGQDGETPFYQQLKLRTEDSDIRLTHGTEMLVLRAEAALRDGDLAAMTALLNDARAEYDMDPLDVPANSAAAWDLMHVERAATTWLEGRRLWDLRRWQAQGGDAVDDFAQGRDVCFPISAEEKRANANLAG